MSSMDIIHLNVGGQRFSTTKETLTFTEESFFTALLSGRISSLKDETGAYFIDRDPKLFAILLTYLRTKELDLSGVDLIILRKEAEFYGLTSLSRKLALCMDSSMGVCGDLFFHGFVPHPDAAADEDTQRDSPLPQERRVSLIRCYYHFLAAVYSNRVALFKVKELSGWRMIWQSSPMDSSDSSAPPALLERLALRSMKLSVPSHSVTTPPAAAGTNLTVGARHSRVLTTQTSHDASAMLGGGGGGVSTGSVGGASASSGMIPSSAPTNNPTAMNAASTAVPILPHARQMASQNVCYLAVSADDCVTLWLINASQNPPSLDQRLIQPVSRFHLNGHHVDELFFVSDKLVALNKQGIMAVWRMTSNSWQMSNLDAVGSYCATSQSLFLGMRNGKIAYIDMDKFPVRLSDNDLLVNHLYQDPDGEPITALSVYITSKNPLMESQLVQIAYGTASGYTRLVAQAPNQSGYGYSFYLMQTLDVHRAPVCHVSFSSRNLISICSENNHVRSWLLHRFRGMLSGQPGVQPLASFFLPCIQTCLHDDMLVEEIYQQGNNPGPWGDQRDEPHILLHKLLPECDQVLVKLASTGEKIFTIRSANHSPIMCFWVHEFNSDMRGGSAGRRIVFTGHLDGSVQMWDLSTAIERHQQIAGLSSLSMSRISNSPASLLLGPGSGGLTAGNTGPLTSLLSTTPNPLASIQLSNVGNNAFCNPNALLPGPSTCPLSATEALAVSSFGQMQEQTNHAEVREMLRMLEGWNLGPSLTTVLSWSSLATSSSRSNTLRSRQRDPTERNS